MRHPSRSQKAFNIPDESSGGFYKRKNRILVEIKKVVIVSFLPFLKNIGVVLSQILTDSSGLYIELTKFLTAS